MREKIKKLLSSSNQGDIAIAFELMLQEPLENIYEILKWDGGLQYRGIENYYPHFKISTDRFIIYYNGTIFAYSEALDHPNKYIFVKSFYLGEHKDYKP